MEPLTPAELARILRTAAFALHALGFNVTAICAGSKEPAHRWNDPHAPWTTTRQTPPVVASLGHGWRTTSRISNGQVFPGVDRIGVICGIGDLRCIDIDAVTADSGAIPVPESVFADLCTRLGLDPSAYPWGGRSPSGAGWHLMVRCPDPLPENQSVMRLAPHDGDTRFRHLELRWHTCQVCLPRHGAMVGYHPDTLTTLPAMVSWERIWTAVTSLARPTSKEAPTRPDHLADAGAGAWAADEPPSVGTPPPDADDALWTSTALPPMLRAAMQRLCAAPPGTRNTALNDAAYRAGRLAASGMAPESIRATLRQIAIARGLPPHEVEHTIESGWKAGQRDGPWPTTSPPPPAAAITIAWGAAIDALPQPIPLIYGVLNVGGVALLVGPSESGKSTVAVHLACTVAQHYPVIYVAAESAGLIRNQIRAWEQTHQRARGRLGVVPHPVPLTDHAQVDALIEAARAAQARLIILDTLSVCIPGLDENDPAMSGIVATLNRIASTVNAAVVVLHHPPKNHSSPYRGHSSLYNNTDTTLALDRAPHDPDRIRVTPVRHKGVRRGPLLFVMQQCTLTPDAWTDPRLGPPSAPVVVPTSALNPESDRMTRFQRDLLALIASLQGDSGVSSAELGRWMQRMGHDEAVVRQQLAIMAQRGWITPVDSPLAPRRLTPAGQQILATPDPHDAASADSSDLEVNLFVNDVLTRPTPPPASTAADHAPAPPTESAVAASEPPAPDAPSDASSPVPHPAAAPNPPGGSPPAAPAVPAVTDAATGDCDDRRPDPSLSGASDADESSPLQSGGEPHGPVSHDAMQNGKEHWHAC